MAHADLVHFTRAGWPRCCGEVTAYVVEAPRPNATDDTDELRALPPDA